MMYYDPAGNLIEKRTENLEDHSSIKYEYEYNRLKKVVFPLDTINNVWYEYGDSYQAGNNAGKITRQVDASGVQDFEYGDMGELVSVRRVMPIPGGEGPLAFETHWHYDSWNRVTSIVYPDGDSINYEYDAGGKLWKVSSTSYQLISEIRYDKFERRTKLNYGNQTSMSYQYNSRRGFLTSLQSSTPGS